MDVDVADLGERRRSTCSWPGAIVETPNSATRSGAAGRSARSRSSASSTGKSLGAGSARRSSSRTARHSRGCQRWSSGSGTTAPLTSTVPSPSWPRRPLLDDLRAVDRVAVEEVGDAARRRATAARSTPGHVERARRRATVSTAQVSRSTSHGSTSSGLRPSAAATKRPGNIMSTLAMTPSARPVAPSVQRQPALQPVAHAGGRARRRPRPRTDPASGSASRSASASPSGPRWGPWWTTRLTYLIISEGCDEVAL